MICSGFFSQGSISSYHSDRYGFSPECKVVAFTGDNPGISYTQVVIVSTYETTQKLYTVSSILGNNFVSK